MLNLNTKLLFQLGDHIYWSNWEKTTIERADKTSGQNRKMVRSRIEVSLGEEEECSRVDGGGEENKRKMRDRRWMEGKRERENKRDKGA